jgi:4-hydroxy-tetrahydrodipicolinate reductase
MNIAIIGYGKMGKMIENAALERKHKISVVIDPLVNEPASLIGTWLCKSIKDADQLDDVDVAIEFTRPDTAVSNILALVERKIPVLVGTTGWYNRMDEVRSAVTRADSSLLWASNFSLGVNIFYRIAFEAAKLMDPLSEYDVGGYEVHHNKKADSPSGTAKTLVEGVLARMKRKSKAAYDMLNRPPEPDELHFASLRVGSAPGVHSLVFDSTADTIEIIHTARNRQGFASGAILAAQWLSNCPGPGQAAGKKRQGIFTMDDVLNGLYQN